MNNIKLEVVNSLSGIHSEDWNSLTNGDPLVSHEFLSAIEKTGNIGGNTGWEPMHLVARQEDSLCGAIALYLKSHSYGEYIFDWAWADAYHRSGLEYYPKLLSAIPFTPATGPRIFAKNELIKKTLARSVLAFAKDNRLSSFHCLYPQNEDLDIWREENCLVRKTIQFHWTNKGYETFDDFLNNMRSAKRKKIRQERKRVKDNGVEFSALLGDEANDDDWRFFYDCYEHTYLIRGSTPYLNFEFFSEIRKTLGNSILLIIARQSGHRIATALNLIGKDTIWGRYWGSKIYIPSLHFETCYYQTIEYAIKHNIKTFEGGAQGEHKLARGLEPVETQSAHWLAHPQFADAIKKFLDREKIAITEYNEELNHRAPFKPA